MIHKLAYRASRSAMMAVLGLKVQAKDLRHLFSSSYKVAVLALVGLFWLVGADSAAAVPFVVADGDFSGGIYELRYDTKTNQLVKNGVSTVLDTTPLDDLFLTNSGNTIHPAWEPASDGSVSYLQAVGQFGGFGGGTNSTFNTSASATMG